MHFFFMIFDFTGIDLIHFITISNSIIQLIPHARIVVIFIINKHSKSY